jgi:hypothetical protein
MKTRDYILLGLILLGIALLIIPVVYWFNADHLTGMQVFKTYWLYYLFGYLLIYIPKYLWK